MIFYSAVKLKELFKKQRDYPWQKPNSCLRCNSCRLWGHGYAEEAKEMQQPLNLLGFDAGPEDGLLGPYTSSAIRAFQNEHSLPLDGYPSPALLKRRRALAAAIP